MPVWDTDRNQESVFNDAIICVVFRLCFPKFSEVLWVNSENLGVMIHRKQSFLVWNLFWSNVVPTWRKLTHFQLRYEKHTVLPRKSFKSCRLRHLNHNLCARSIGFILLLNLLSIGSAEGQYWIVSLLPQESLCKHWMSWATATQNHRDPKLSLKLSFYLLWTTCDTHPPWLSVWCWCQYAPYHWFLRNPYRKLCVQNAVTELTDRF